MSRYKLGYVAPLKECPGDGSGRDWWRRDAREQKITAKDVIERLSYDPLTGVFMRIKGKRAGRRAGWLGAQGYWYIRVKSCGFVAHRLAWIYMTGAWPKNEVDHKDTDRSNNKWVNLREATHGQNQSNGKIYKNNKIGLKGVSTIPTRPGWFRARIRKNGHEVSLGVWPTAERAHEAYMVAAKNLHGEFAREK